MTPEVIDRVEQGSDWERRFLARRLSVRARRVGAAYAGPGAGRDVPGGERPPIAFTGGLPDPVVHPAAELAEATAAVLAEDADGALQYGGAQGFTGLREWLAGHWSVIERLPLTPDHFTLTNGAAGALANVCDTFLDEGDVAVVEEVSFPGSVRTIRSVTPRVECVPVDDEGLDVDALVELLGRLEREGTPARLLYTIPTFQNPTGSTLSLKRRHRLLELAARHQTLVVEDEAYAELCFYGAPPPSLYSLSGGEGVIKLGTMSKIIAPGLRIGWCQARPALVDALVATRSDMGTGPLGHRVAARVAMSGYLDGHIARLREHYARKCRVMLDALARSCAGRATWNHPQGGFFVWATLAEGVEPLALVDSARDEGVSFVGGHVFAADQALEGRPRHRWGPGESRYLRLAFSYVSEERISEGIDRLGRALARADVRCA